MKYIIGIYMFLSLVSHASALVISEVMSNPVGDDGGREWLEIYNNSDESIDISSLAISIKGGNPITVTPVLGGVTIDPRGYAIIASVVSGTTKFPQDYPSYTGPLLRSSLSLVNTGVTSLEIKVQGQTVDILASYTAAKEGNTYSLINGVFSSGSPTPGTENRALAVEEPSLTTTPTNTQTTLPQSAPPVADIVFYLPKEKMVVAGAPAFFQVSSTNHDGAAINNLTYIWSFGDGGQSVGATTTHRFYYPGRYVVEVEGTNGIVAGKGRMNVVVVAPELQLSSILTGKYGVYLDITNPSPYDLDLSGWYITIDGAGFKFPKNTIIGNGTTHFPGLAMGFASTTISSGTVIKLLFPNMEEVVRVIQVPQENNSGTILSGSLSSIKTVSLPATSTRNSSVSKAVKKNVSKPVISTSSPSTASSTVSRVSSKKDVRLANFLRSFLGKE